MHTQVDGKDLKKRELYMVAAGAVDGLLAGVRSLVEVVNFRPYRRGTYLRPN